MQHRKVCQFESDYGYYADMVKLDKDTRHLKCLGLNSIPIRVRVSVLLFICKYCSKFNSLFFVQFSKEFGDGPDFRLCFWRKAMYFSSFSLLQERSIAILVDSILSESLSIGSRLPDRFPF